MRRPRVAVRIATAWVNTYTKGLPERVRLERRVEVADDLDEQEEAGVRAGTRHLAVHVLARTALGMAADVDWRYRHRRRRQHPTMTILSPVRLVHHRRPRGPGIAYAALSVLLVIVVGTLALTSPQTPPPTIAEFAPQAVEQITDSSQNPGGRRGGTSDESPTLDELTGENDPARQTLDVARVRQCVGDPPRQIEDPQSPPCVPHWSGDNGGATSRGVTRDEIRITDVFYFAEPGFLQAFFNRRFEFYGRRIRLIPRSFPSWNPAEQRATARAAYEQDQAFASTGPAPMGHSYIDELARLGVVAVAHDPSFPETYLAARRPYVWTYRMANDRMFASVGSWYCSRFAGRNAVHSGDPILQASRRKVGIILTQAGQEGTSPEPMQAQLTSCGARTDAVIQDSNQIFFDSQYDASFFQNAMLQMKAAGVTTLACLCQTNTAGVGMRAATNQGYFPEWLLTSYISNDSSIWFRKWHPPEQTRSLMLLTMQPMERTYSDHPSTWALDEVSGRASAYNSDNAILGPYDHDYKYQQLLVFASGLQMAGPHLTPVTFERGLHRAGFPNPWHRIMAGSVGFKDGDHSMTDDAAEVWWSNMAQSPYGEGPGTFCYVDHGARRRIGTFASDDPFFKGECDNGTK